MLKIIMLSVLMGVAGAGMAQEFLPSGAGVVTSISPEGRELIVGQEIYLIPEQVKMDGILVARAKVASLLRPGDQVLVQFGKGRTVESIHSRLR